jgi:hypothetical protein
VISQVALGKFLKATYAAALAFLTGLTTIFTGNQTLGDITEPQWTVLVAWTLAAFGSVYGLAGWSGPTMRGVTKDEGGE